MKKTLFYGAAAAATMHAHKRYAAVFFVLAVVGIAAAFFTRPKKRTCLKASGVSRGTR